MNSNGRRIITVDRVVAFIVILILIWGLLQALGYAQSTGAAFARIDPGSVFRLEARHIIDQHLKDDPGCILAKIQPSLETMPVFFVHAGNDSPEAGVIAGKVLVNVDRLYEDMPLLYIHEALHIGKVCSADRIGRKAPTTSCVLWGNWLLNSPEITKVLKAHLGRYYAYKDRRRFRKGSRRSAD